MKTSPRISALALTATALLAISACGGSDSSSEAAPRTKNAALPSKQGMNIQPQQQPTITTQAPFQAPATTAVLVQEKSVDCKTTTTVAGQNSINSQKPTQQTTPTQKLDPRKIGNPNDNMAVPTTLISTLKDYSAPTTTTQVKDCVTTAAVVPTTAPATTSTSASTAAPTTLAPTTTASAKTNIAPVVTSPPTTAKKPICDAVRKKQRLC